MKSLMVIAVHGHPGCKIFLLSDAIAKIAFITATIAASLDKANLCIFTQTVKKIIIKGWFEKKKPFNL